MKLSTALLAASFSRLATAALSNEQLISVFGSDATLTGASVALPRFEFSIVTNDTHALVTLNATTSAVADVGWLGIGTGTRMQNADFLIAWPGEVSWTLSHRQSPSGENMPVAASSVEATSTSAFYTFLPELSTSDAASSFTAVSFLRLLAAPADYPSTSTFTSLTKASTRFIYASSSVKPDGEAEDAVITQHNQPHSTTTLDLSAPISLSAVDAGAGGETTADTPVVAAPGSARSRRDMLLIAHAVTGSLALVLFSPIAILIGRFLRGFSWFPIHAGIQLLAATLVIICFGIGTYCTGTPHFTDNHTRLGLVLLILVLLQVTLGAFAHRTTPRPSPGSRFSTLSGKPLIRLIHIFLGLVISVLGFAQVRTGFGQWEEDSDALTSVPMGVVVVFWVIAGVVAAAYIFGWVKEARAGPRQLRDKEVASEMETLKR